MMSILRKLFAGHHDLGDDHSILLSPMQRKLKNIKAIWNNDHNDDIGIEKVLRLILATSQLFFVGTYLKQIFGKKNEIRRNLVIDFYVLFKCLFPLFLIYHNYTSSPILFWLVFWFMLETLLYIPTLIFASDLFTKPRSYGRSMLLLFINYLEIIMAFAYMYASSNGMNQPFEHWFDPIYFSCITSASVGYGDYFPITTYCKMLVSTQSIILILFVVLFLNFFSGRVERKGYFSNDA